MDRDVTHWLIEDSDYFDPPDLNIDDVLDDESVLESFNDNTSYEDIIP